MYVCVCVFRWAGRVFFVALLPRWADSGTLFGWCISGSQRREPEVTRDPLGAQFDHVGTQIAHVGFQVQVVHSLPHLPNSKRWEHMFS